MNDDLFENLVRRYPDIFQKSGDFEFSINDGWYDIIDTLLSLISYPLDNARGRLKHTLKYSDLKSSDKIKELEETIINEIEKLPIIVQIKEKFGGLRFYIENGSDTVYNYIDFAEHMSYKVCEKCGSPGKSRSLSWIKVLCDQHYREIENNIKSVP